VRTRADTTGALLRALVVAGLLVGALLMLGWVGVGEPDPPPAPAMPAEPRDGALVLPRPPAGSR